MNTYIKKSIKADNIKVIATIAGLPHTTWQGLDTFMQDGIYWRRTTIKIPQDILEAKLDNPTTQKIAIAIKIAACSIQHPIQWSITGNGSVIIADKITLDAPPNKAKPGIIEKLTDKLEDMKSILDPGDYRGGYVNGFKRAIRIVKQHIKEQK